MRVFVVTPPAPVVSYAEAVARLRLAGGSDEKDDVEMMIAAATALIDGPDGWLGRAIGPQILEARLDAFCAAIELPCPPVAAIVSVKYVDAAGAEQAVAPEDYYLAGRRLAPAPGKSWPTPRSQAEAVRIRYDAGYATVPANIKSAILLMTGDQYRHRDSAPELSIAAERLLEPVPGVPLMATLAAGDLDRLVIFKRAPIVDDGISRNRGVPAEIGRRWAKKDDVADGERLRAGQQAQDLTTRFLMRWDTLTISIKVTDILECEGETFEVVGNKEARGYDRRSTREITAAARPDL